MAEIGVQRRLGKDGFRTLDLRPQTYAVRVRRAVIVTRKREKTEYEILIFISKKFSKLHKFQSQFYNLTGKSHLFYTTFGIDEKNS